MKKMNYLGLITKVDKTVNGKDITMKATLNDGQTLTIKYRDGHGIDHVEISATDKSGRASGASCFALYKYNKDMLVKRTYIKRRNAQFELNELIWQLNRISIGLNPVDGEYNHHYPICWVQADKEIYSIYSGDVIPDTQNKLHWNLCLKIYQATGFKCRIPSYSVPCYRLAGVETITRSVVKSLARKGYLSIMQDDGDPNKEVN